MTHCCLLLFTKIMLHNVHHLSQSRVFTIWGAGRGGERGGGGEGSALRARLVKAMEQQQVPNPAEPSFLPVSVVTPPLTSQGWREDPGGNTLEVLGKRESTVQTKELSPTSPSLWDLSKGVPET